MSIKINSTYAFQYDNWEIRETALPTRNLRFHETVFSQGNGYIGFRGSFEEPYLINGDKGHEGNYLNGFYDNIEISYGESAYAFPLHGQTMLNVVNAKGIRVSFEDETFNMGSGNIEAYQRTLSFKSGTLKREHIWTSPKGKKISFSFERLISFKYRNIAVIRCRIVPYNFCGELKVTAILDADVRNIAVSNDPRVGSGLKGDMMITLSAESESDFSYIARKTKTSGLSLCSAMLCSLASGDYRRSSSVEKDLIESNYFYQVSAGDEIIFDKYICYTDSRDFKEDELVDAARSKLKEARAIGFDNLKKDQGEYLDHFWRVSDVEVTGDSALQQGLRYNIFQLLQSVGKDGHTNISAKGLSGEGYEGHYFWDTETYIIPFFTYTMPEISRKLVEYRYSVLDNARERARQMGHEAGALFAWRTINGDECSAYFPAGTAQYHIDADIALAIKKYWEATDDTAFLCDYGAEIVFETARLWYDLGHFNPNKGGMFCINCVTGPDEYNAMVNNNCYTNFMACENLKFALEIAELLRRDYPYVYKSISARIGLKKEEFINWEQAADNIYIPFDEKMGIHLQDDSFLDKKIWNFENTPQENHPLLMYYHPLVIYRYNVCKQADIILALFLLGNQFTIEQKKRDFDYYEKVTTHDSSLSTSIFCIIACELGYHEKALHYFLSSARMDLDDINGNTRDGIHTANMAGTWMCIVNGFAGMRVYGIELSFRPILPEEWNAYNFRITFLGSLLKVDVNKSGVDYHLLDGKEITFNHYDKTVELNETNKTVHVDFIFLIKEG